MNIESAGVKVCVVIVTYGDRFKFLKQVIDACLREDVNKIIVVDNASAERSRKALKEYEACLKNKLRVIYLDRNTGSASGYKRGLEEAYKCKNCGFIWLLDDDNIPSIGALKNYFSYLNGIAALKKLEKNRIVLLGFRDSRPQYVDAYKLCSGEFLLEPENSFIGFHIFYFFRKLFLKKYKLKTLNKSKNDCKYIKIPIAPYGGLFFSREILRKVGFPDENYYLYEDDTDFTYRMVKNGINIFLVPEIKIEDLDNYWCKNDKKEKHPYFFGNENRFYYFMRNKVFFQRKYRTKNNIIWKINKSIYDIRMFLLSLLYKKINRFNLYRRAINDALNKNMGKRKKRILFISHVLDGSGAPRSLLNLIKYMPKDDIEIDLIALRRSDLKEDFEKALNKKIEIITPNPPKNKLLKILERIWGIPQIAYLILKKNPDLVFINSAANSRAILISKLLGYKTFVYVREFNEEFAFLPKLRRRFINLADKVFCLSKIHKRWLIEEVGYKKDIVILPNGINLEEVNRLRLEEPEENYKKFIEKYKFLIANVGYLTLRKGWDYLLEIIKKFSNNEETGFVIIGDFVEKGDRERFLKEIEKLNMKNRIYITGITKNVFKYLKYCDLTAITSKSETFSRVALESMSLGIPFIFFDVGAIKTVAPEDYPYKVKPFDINQFVSYILEIKELKEKGKLDSLKYKLMETSKQYDIKQISKEFYNEIIKVKEC